MTIEQINLISRGESQIFQPVGSQGKLWGCKINVQAGKIIPSTALLIIPWIEGQVPNGRVHFGTGRDQETLIHEKRGKPLRPQMYFGRCL